MEGEFNKKDVMVMKLLHYFITDKDYHPVIVHGVQNEIWLENLDSDYKIIRIVSNYIHNNEQLEYDLFKTKQIAKNIKKKTFKFNVNILNIFVDLGENVELRNEKNIDCIEVRNMNDVKKYDFLYQYFPDIDKHLEFNEKGVSLFMKIADDINIKNQEDARKADEIFKPKTPIVTFILIALNILVFAYGFLFRKSDFLVNVFSTFGPYIRNGEYYRLITGAFVHVDFFHLLFNMYALSIVGRQAESFFGKVKYLLIYFGSLITASLLSIILNIDTASIGASGAIFGILGALFCFGLNYRIYLGNSLVKQMVPIILLNLLIGFTFTGIDNFAHIGGLIGGFLIAKAVGLKFKSSKADKINGIVMLSLYVIFLILFNFVYL